MSNYNVKYSNSQEAMAERPNGFLWDWSDNAEVLKLAEEIKFAHQNFLVASESGQKSVLRKMHEDAKRINPEKNSTILLKKLAKRQMYFASGSRIDPNKIQPQLYSTADPLFYELFQIARGFWSIPQNKGYGRRIRAVVFDNYHNAVIGVIGLQSPPADLQSRDNLFNYPEGQKINFVNNTLDAYAVGAIPPYSNLLGGKLCAGLISSDTIRQLYWRKYVSQKSLMKGVKTLQSLVAVTTTSAYGRSSLYNRLKFNSRLLAEPIGYTLGYGTIHLEHLYVKMCDFMNWEKKLVKNGFGNGPKVRWQNMVNCMISLGLPSKLLRHGLKREVFLFRFVENLEQGMMGEGYGNPICLSEYDFSDYWKERWAIPRSSRTDDWRSIDSVSLLRESISNFNIKK